jgi:hypothetical protein
VAADGGEVGEVGEVDGREGAEGGRRKLFSRAGSEKVLGI